MVMIIVVFTLVLLFAMNASIPIIRGDVFRRWKQTVPPRAQRTHRHSTLFDDDTIARYPLRIISQIENNS